MDQALLELARAQGIIFDYYDIWGRQHHVGEATLRAVLGAMGLEAGDAAAVRRSLDESLRRRWRRVLAPATVLGREPGRRTLRLQLPAADLGRGLTWSVRCEDGRRTHSGGITPSALPVAETAQIDGREHVGLNWELPVDLPLGYHRLEIAAVGASAWETLLAMAPARCYCPPALEGDGRAWGVACQLYGVRSERNWGIGDFTDLLTLIQQWGLRGGSVVGLNPLHALYPHNPAHSSPYSPSSRLFKSWMYIDVEACAEFRECEPARELTRSAAFQLKLRSLRETELVDYPGAAAAKREVLELLYLDFRKRHLDTGSARARQFRAFQAEGGEALRLHALFEALQEHLARKSPEIWGWPAWPEPFRQPGSEAVARFAAEHLERIEFYEYLQWQCDLQLGTAARRSFELGLGVGIYEDLAVSIDRGGAEAWANQEVYATSASIGAPPDDFALNGQNWGLPPIIPQRLCEAGYAPFIATLRANMRHAGALRIDHVMGLMRLFWVPPGGEAADGVYVRYPFEDLLGLLKLESERNRCLVIGEDLGTVPDEVRSALESAGVLSYRLLYFERHAGGEFKPPRDYPAQALVTASTHDLPTLVGWWEGRDLTLRSQLGLFPDETTRDAQIVGRAQDRARLLLALEHERMLPAGIEPHPVTVPAMTTELTAALLGYLAATPAKLMVTQLEDVLGSADQANLPGTTDQHPNWRRKLPLALERFPGEERFVRLVEALTAARPGRKPLRQGRRTERQAVIPRCTYRLQLHRDFGFDRAAELVPYLAELGVSHVYCSPYLRARAGSTHGYDIIDHSALNPEIGNRDDFERFVTTLKRHGMGQILDMVPNHMGVMGRDNAWWMDVLENGPASAYAGYFDIDWRTIDPEFANRVVVPVLGDHYGAVLERGELRLEFEPAAGSFAVYYYDHRFPIDPREYPRILERAVRSLGSAEIEADARALAESLAASMHHLPPRDATEPDAAAERTRDKEVHKRRLARMAANYPVLGEAIERSVRYINGVNGEPDRFRPLHELLESQAYRLAYWRVAGDDINYRRFFDINDLAALRMENDAAFEATHRFVLELAASGEVDGLRIDHPDGLFEPERYFRKLQERYVQLAFAANGSAPPDAATRPLYVVVEKITAVHERLPTAWTVHGTTGYRFANAVNGLFVDTEARSKVDRTWRAFVGDEALSFDEASYRGKRIVLTSALAGELTVLTRRLLRLARADRRTRDYTINTLQRAVAEVIGHFPVYRTYIAAQSISRQDRRYIDWAIGQARTRARGADGSVFDFLRSVLLVELPPDTPEPLQAECRAISMRFQQLTSPVAAKGIEDTAFYVFNRLVSLNDVGGDPEIFGTRPAAFHRGNRERAAKWPHTLLATSTHDNKRSEDVRARIDVISELPAAWRLLVRRWSRMNRTRKRTVDDAVAPSRNDEFLLYQTLIGSFPVDASDETLAAYRTRVEAYMLKAAREAKVRTSWLNLNEAYEAALTEFVRSLLVRTGGNLFLDDLTVQARVFAWYGALNSIAMTAVKLTSPGVPDIFQGNETLDFSLVDPDNRRPVDYRQRRDMLAELRALAELPRTERPVAVQELAQAALDGRAKMWVLLRALDLRRRNPELFAGGDYLPVHASGERERNVIAYCRRMNGSGVVVAAGRMFASLGLEPGTPPLGDAWSNTRLNTAMLPPGARLTDWVTGATMEPQQDGLELARTFAHFPVAILHYDMRSQDDREPV